MKNLLMFTAIFFISLVNAQDKGVFQYHEGAELYQATRAMQYESGYGETENDVQWISFSDPEIKKLYGNPKTIIEKFKEGIGFHRSGTYEDGSPYETVDYLFYVVGTPINYKNDKGQRVTESTTFNYNMYYQGFYHVRGKVHRFITKGENGTVAIYEAIRIN